MSKIRIPVVSIYVQPNGSRRNLDCDITITDDHLRQIRDGIAALEAADKPAQPDAPRSNCDVCCCTGTVWLNDTPDMCDKCSGTGRVLMPNQMAQPDAPPLFVGNFEFAQLAADVAKQMPPGGWTTKAQPDSDEAATRALQEAIEKASPCSPWNAARAVLSVIRRGEVPGIDDETYWRDANTAAQKEIAALRARVAELEAFTNRQETAYASVCMERDAARAKEDALRAELREAKAEAERAKAERNGMHVKNYREMMEARSVLRKIVSEIDAGDKSCPPRLWLNESFALEIRRAAGVEVK